MQNNLYFYRDLPALPSFGEATAIHRHADVPADWWVIVADVAGSTRAIQAGAYKSVNTVGVACIAAIVNLDRGIDLPFSFGGDGATFAIPGDLRERAVIALRGAQRLSREQFGLDLRVGLARVGDLAAQGYWVRLGKLRLSSNVTLPVLSGRGWEEVERRIKDDSAKDVLHVREADGLAEASFEGFECRWQGVPSFNDHKLSLLVAATLPEAADNMAVYQRVLARIHQIYGEVAQYHPLRADRLRLAFGPRALSHEWRVRSGGLGAWRRGLYFARLWLLNAVGYILFTRNIDTEAVRWSRYRDELVENSDFRKFDGMLRMVLDGTEAQAERLEQWLAAECQAGHLAYGMHKSREALVTCLVQSYNGKHLHFVDGGDGGYALAARSLKARLRQNKDVQ